MDGTFALDLGLLAFLPTEPRQATTVRDVPDDRPELAEERRLVARAQAGDRAALGAILRKYGPLLFRSVLLPRLGHGLAEEALSMTYEKILDKLGQFTWQDVGIYPWLRVVSMRIALDLLRARRRETPVEAEILERELDAASSQPETRTDALVIARDDEARQRARVFAALEEINPRYAAAIRMRILEERPREEVAKALSVSTATFDVVLHRALAAMKKALTEDSEDA